jgi:hypothetical protein
MGSSYEREPPRGRKRHTFTQDEDFHLHELVAKYGDNAWEKIAQRMLGRDRRQCRERWMNYLSPTVENGPWTSKEEDCLREHVFALGRSWKAIQQFFPGRTDINIKNHWKQMKKAGVTGVKSDESRDIFEQLESSWMSEESLFMNGHTKDYGLGSLF